tara:strand:- start:215 stop:598 length:384 start_codon:yes stop_codon:yes gene_type:complete
MHRAKKILESFHQGSLIDPFVEAEAIALRIVETHENIARNELNDVATHYSEIVKPQKDALLSQYRSLRQEFKRKSVPILKKLDELDEKNRHATRSKKQELAAVKRRKREILRNIGMHPLRAVREDPQ